MAVDGGADDFDTGRDATLPYGGELLDERVVGVLGEGLFRDAADQSRLAGSPDQTDRGIVDVHHPDEPDTLRYLLRMPPEVVPDVLHAGPAQGGQPLIHRREVLLPHRHRYGGEQRSQVRLRPADGLEVGVPPGDVEDLDHMVRPAGVGAPQSGDRRLSPDDPAVVPQVALFEGGLRRRSGRQPMVGRRDDRRQGPSPHRVLRVAQQSLERRVHPADAVVVGEHHGDGGILEGTAESGLAVAQPPGHVGVEEGAPPDGGAEDDGGHHCGGGDAMGDQEQGSRRRPETGQVEGGAPGGVEEDHCRAQRRQAEAGGLGDHPGRAESEGQHRGRPQRHEEGGVRSSQAQLHRPQDRSREPAGSPGRHQGLIGDQSCDQGGRAEGVGGDEDELRESVGHAATQGAAHPAWRRKDRRDSHAGEHRPPGRAP